MSKPEVPLSTNESNFIRQALAGGLRVDGRTPTDYRSISISFPGASGTCEVQLGRTRVYAVTTADLVTPFPDRPNEGFLNMFVNYSPMASTSFEAGYANDAGIQISRVVDRGLRESRAIDTESLCVLSGEKVWTIRVDVHVIDQDGNMLDAINIATISALLHFRRPDITVVGESITVHSVEDRQPVPLALHHLPIACSFVFFDNSTTSNNTAASASSLSSAQSSSSSSVPLYVLDPSYKEEMVSEGSLTITLNTHGEICCLSKSGGLGVESDLIMQCSQIALVKTQEITALIQQRIKSDLATQNTGNAVRGQTQPVYTAHAPAKPIDVFGKNIVKPSGQHLVAGKPIEVNMNRKEMVPGGEEKSDNEEEEDDEDGDDEEDDEDGDAEMNDRAAADQEEFNQVAKKLQSKANIGATNVKSNAATTGQRKK